ncbi:MAG: hypothetical protein ACC660_07455, partial [Acidimicrobiales bacterium]
MKIPTTRTFAEQVDALETDWVENPRWEGVERDYTAADVVKLRGSVRVEHSLARHGAARLWDCRVDHQYRRGSSRRFRFT